MSHYRKSFTTNSGTLYTANESDVEGKRRGGSKSPRSAPIQVSRHSRSGEATFSPSELIYGCRDRNCVRWGLLLHLLVLFALTATFGRRAGSRRELVGLPSDYHFVNAALEETTDYQKFAHVFTLSKGVWTPRTDFLDDKAPDDDAQQQAISSVLFSSSSAPGSANVHNGEGNAFLGYVRVSKTGSSSLEKFVKNSLHSGHKYLLRETDYLGTMNKWLDYDPMVFKGGMLACVYGPKLKLSPSHDWAFEMCPHLRYPELVRFWAKSLPFWAPPEGHPFSKGSEHQAISMSLETFTMIRDPFDRLVSYFYYVKNDAPPDWKNHCTKRQNELIQAGDLSGWMELLHTEGGGLVFDLPNQYRHFSDDIDRAISLVEGNSPRVLTLLNECFNASVRLLVEKKGKFFVPESADAFLYSNDSKKNTSTKRTNETDVTKANLRYLRQNATVWFADDFRFYHAAVKQFKHHLASSNLKPSELQTCRYWDDNDARETNLVGNDIGLREGNAS